ncbi:hypothetical protein J5N97_025336 [Dioscorea zingiberensis]|uniref:RRM domain-containing protein n=1 Tax=Dioscorea zingiberensis TaxID=325984 RepID=A0A9D5H9J6_9LILI|nr:hypothetical protein J5N97_025336 [Dioscorea zingiberensis]
MRTVFCGNFDFDTRHSDLERLFSRYGRVNRVDMKSGISKGELFVGSPKTIHANGNLLATTSAPTSHYRHPSFPSYDHSLLSLHLPTVAITSIIIEQFRVIVPCQLNACSYEW